MTDVVKRLKSTLFEDLKTELYEAEETLLNLRLDAVDKGAHYDYLQNHRNKLYSEIYRRYKLNRISYETARDLLPCDACGNIFWEDQKSWLDQA